MFIVVLVLGVLLGCFIAGVADAIKEDNKEKDVNEQKQLNGNHLIKK